MSLELTEDNVTLARFIAAAIGTSPKILIHYSKDDDSLPVLYLTDPDNEQIKYYSTIGVSDYPNILKTDGKERNVPVELLIAGYDKYDTVPDSLSTCGLLIKKFQWKCFDGAIFLDILETSFPNAALKHLFFIEPILWKDKLPPFLELENKVTYFILAIPITEKEKEYQKKNGTVALKKLLFEENKIDIYDFSRKSVI